MRRLLLLFLGLIVLGGAVFGGYQWYADQQQAPPQYLTVQVERGRIAATVGATGTLNAVVSVQVGSQVSGRIAQLFADYNSPVTAGQIIAQLDPATFEARVGQARANLANAQAAIQVAQANVENAQAAINMARSNAASAQAAVEKARVAVVDARRTLERQKAMQQRDLIAQRDLDAAQTALDSTAAELRATQARYEAAQGQGEAAEAQKRLAQAQVAAARAQVAQTEAALQAAALDLANTTIRSPVNGIVIARNVDVGQTVAASLQAPILFLIAQDLTQMQIDTNVSEADIGQVRQSQAVTFTVDAYPERTFTGTVTQVRNAPITVQNVVTYNAVVAVDNTDLRLKPGMTANVTFIIAERQGVLKVPNTALRFQPEGAASSATSTEPRGDWTAALQQRLTQALSLTPEQQEQVRGILAKARQQGQQSNQQDLSEEERRQRRQAARVNTRAQIRQILTEEQRGRYDELVKSVDQRREGGGTSGRTGRLWIVGENDLPQAVPVQLGIADDTMTEILAGEIQEGQAVIAGLQTASKRPGSVTTPGFGPRRL